MRLGARALLCGVCLVLALASAEVPITSALDGNALTSADATPTSLRSDSDRRAVAATAAPSAGKKLPPGLTGRLWIGTAMPAVMEALLDSEDGAAAFEKAVASALSLADGDYESVTIKSVQPVADTADRLLVVFRLSFTRCDLHWVDSLLDALPAKLSKAVTSGELYDALHGANIAATFVAVDGEPVLRTCRPTIKLFEGPESTIGRLEKHVTCVYTGHHVVVKHGPHSNPHDRHSFYCRHTEHEETGEHRCECRHWRMNEAALVPGVATTTTTTETPLTEAPTVVDVDCEMSDWGEWEVCPAAPCHSAQTRRYRVIDVYPSGNGKQCPTKEEDTQSCTVPCTTTTSSAPPATTAEQPDNGLSLKQDDSAAAVTTASPDGGDWWNMDSTGLSDSTGVADNTAGEQFALVTTSTDAAVVASTIDPAFTIAKMCAISPPQLCRKKCPAVRCLHGLCAMREGTCCNFKCVWAPKPASTSTSTTSTSTTAVTSTTTRSTSTTSKATTTSTTATTTSTSTSMSTSTSTTTTPQEVTESPYEIMEDNLEAPTPAPMDTATTTTTTTSTTTPPTTTTSATTLAPAPSTTTQAPITTPAPAPLKWVLASLCHDSPAQTCRMTCEKVTCPENRCAMRLHGCCDFSCVTPTATTTTTTTTTTAAAPTTVAAVAATTLAADAEPTRLCGCPRAEPCQHDGGRTCFAADAGTGQCRAQTTRCKCPCWGDTPCSSPQGSCHALQTFAADNSLVCPAGTTRCPADDPNLTTQPPVPAATVVNTEACRCGTSNPCQRVGGSTCFAASMQGQCPPETTKCNCPCMLETPCSVVERGVHQRCVAATRLLGDLVCGDGTVRCLPNGLQR